jgi:hypothetical protein
MIKTICQQRHFLCSSLRALELSMSSSVVKVNDDGDDHGRHHKWHGDHAFRDDDHGWNDHYRDWHR